MKEKQEAFDDNIEIHEVSLTKDNAPFNSKITEVLTLLEQKNTRFIIDGLVSNKNLERFEEFKKASGKKTKIGVFNWMLENLRL